MYFLNYLTKLVAKTQHPKLYIKLLVVYLYSPHIAFRFFNFIFFPFTSSKKMNRNKGYA